MVRKKNTGKVTIKKTKDGSCRMYAKQSDGKTKLVGWGGKQPKRKKY